MARWSGPRSQRSISALFRSRTIGRSRCRVDSSCTRPAVLPWVFQAQRTMCSGSVNTVRIGGSTLPFHSCCRRSRRTMVRRTTCRITVNLERSSQISRSARSASRARTESYCHSVTQQGPSLKRCTSSSNEARFVQDGPWNMLSISTCGACSSRATRPASVVLPEPDVPATRTRRGHRGRGAAASSRGTTIRVIASHSRSKPRGSAGKCRRIGRHAKRSPTALSSRIDDCGWSCCPAGCVMGSYPLPRKEGVRGSAGTVPEMLA